mmetsp:Transcript_515/g.1761  ORF Transcript_515/g.1761 Transcript_515/m.1761 type:complete len:298 (-) Transcript_515:28-921(-)
MFPFAALFGLSLVLPRRVQIIPRARVVASAANDTLTVGDALAGSLRRNIADLPEHEHLARAERTLDAMLVSGSAELDALQREFDRDLAQTSDSLDQELTSGLQRVAATYNETFDYAAAELDTVFASTRDGVRRDLASLVEAAAEHKARTRPPRRRRAFRHLWRSSRRALRSGAPKHPVVLVSEVSAVALSLLLLAAAADAASASHALLPASWPAVRALLCLWVGSFGVILLRSATDDWAAAAEAAAAEEEAEEALAGVAAARAGGTCGGRTTGSETRGGRADERGLWASRESSRFLR